MNGSKTPKRYSCTVTDYQDKVMDKLIEDGVFTRKSSILGYALQQYLERTMEHRGFVYKAVIDSSNFRNRRKVSNREKKKILESLGIFEE